MLYNSKFGRFLRLFFGCHGRPDRSFFFKGEQLPICARCTGMFLGIFAGIAFSIISGKFKIGFFPILLLALPGVVDGFLQHLTKYESNNIKRLLTGILLGIAFIFLIFRFHFLMVMLAIMMLDFLGIPHIDMFY